MRRTGEFENAKPPENDGFWSKMTPATKEIVEQRIKKCKMCEELTEWNICEQCKCWMPLKVKFEGQSCPLDKW